MRHFILSFSAVILLGMGLSACDGSAREDLKSPCVGTEESPCGPKRSVNDWWLA